ncbi:hypothetical protein PVAND_003259 [Polypedilum vanderplanki]|uniref:Uncharacterized protein n=1 Tax=Polypedilum vanderplanki TaxID=319348 RepID=A0A9J6BU10_POLVA|nr:hypothetical protein PVAND_003259 [Polypedilum vanderplanki]
MSQKICLIFVIILCVLELIVAQERTNKTECDPQINCRIILFDTNSNLQIADFYNKDCQCGSGKNCVVEYKREDRHIYYCR